MAASNRSADDSQRPNLNTRAGLITGLVGYHRGAVPTCSLEYQIALAAGWADNLAEIKAYPYDPLPHKFVRHQCLQPWELFFKDSKTRTILVAAGREHAWRTRGTVKAEELPNALIAHLLQGFHRHEIPLPQAPLAYVKEALVHLAMDLGRTKKAESDQKVLRGADELLKGVPDRKSDRKEEGQAMYEEQEGTLFLVRKVNEYLLAEYPEEAGKIIMAILLLHNDDYSRAAVAETVGIPETTLRRRLDDVGDFLLRLRDRPR